MLKDKKKKKGFKYWIGRVHLWLGLTSGLIVLLLAVTGCIYVFSQEITEWLRREQLYVTEVRDEKLPITQVWKQTQQAVGSEKVISSVNVYNDPHRSIEFNVYKAAEGGIWYFDHVEQYYSIYVDPYTGKVLGIYDEEADFFNIVKMLHWSLLLDTSIGQTITGWATLIFVVMLITGIILWWPKNKAARKQRMSFQWKDGTKWRRKNYDVHNILGFYISSIAIIIAFTGMVWAFSWFQAIVYVAGSGTLTPPDIKTEKSVMATGDKDQAIQNAYAISKIRHREADAFRLSPPAPSDTTGVINVYIQQYKGVYHTSHNLQFDQYTGKLLRERLHSEKNFGEKLITANYDIHVGAILGIPGKILAFIASFICAMLPITGFLIWWGRRNKKAKKAKA